MNLSNCNRNDSGSDSSIRDDNFDDLHPDLQTLCTLFDDMSHEKLSAEEACKNNVFKGVKGQISEFM